MSLDNTGLAIPTYAERRAEYAERLQALAGGNTPTDEGTVEGDLLTLMAMGVQEIHELVAAVHTAAYPRTSTGASLDRSLYWFVGRRTEGAPSSVTLPMEGTALATIAAGVAVLPDDGSDIRWILTEDVDLDGAGEGEGVFEAEEDGPLLAVAATEWTIVTPVPNLTAVGPNATDATPGNLDESDESYRLRGQSAIAEGDLEAAAWSVDGVTLVTLLENPTSTPDAFWGEIFWAELLIVGGDDDAIAAALHEARGPGRQLLGNTSAVVSAPGWLPNDEVTIPWSRPSDVDIWVEIEVTKGEKYPTSTGTEAEEARAALFAAAVITFGATLQPGDNVYSGAINAAAFGAVVGVKSLTVLVGSADPPLASEVVIALRQQAVFDTSRITITEV
jgi:uncharacterized phage protein gp47/JayE